MLSYNCTCGGYITHMPSLPFIPFANCAEVVIQLTQQAIPWILTFGMEDSVPITLAELSLLFTAIDTWVTTDLSGQVSSNPGIYGSEQQRQFRQGNRHTILHAERQNPGYGLLGELYNHLSAIRKRNER